MECTRLHDLAPEVALGLLDGAERAEVLAHLERCATCQADVASLTEIGEQLLLLAPEVPPPAGFETRVLEQVAAPAASARHLRRRTQRLRPLSSRAVVAIAAALVLVLAMAGLVLGMRGDGGTKGADVAASAPMQDVDGNTVGAVKVLKGSPPTLQLDVADWVDTMRSWDNPPPGPWAVSVMDDAGSRESYDLSVSDGTAEIALDHGDLGTVHTVALLDGQGHILCTGTFA